MMRTSPAFITVLMAGCVSLLCVAGGKEYYGTQCENTAVQLTAHKGGSLTFHCKYKRRGTNTVIGLCKEDENFKCKSLILAHKAPITKTDRYTLKYTDLEKDKDNYKVKILKLEPEDAGKYRCEVKGSEGDQECLTEFQLQILEDTDLSGSPQHDDFLDGQHLDDQDDDSLEDQHSDDQDDDSLEDQHLDDQDDDFLEDQHIDVQDEDKSDKNESNAGKSGLIGSMAAALVLILILMVGLLLIRFKSFKTPACCAARGSSEQTPNTDQNTQGDHGEHFSDEIQDQQGSSGGKLQTVYATVKPPTEEIHYTSINVHAGSVDGDAPPDQNKNGSSACVYSTVVTHGPPHPLKEE